MVRRLRHSAAADPRERAEMNALLVATDQEDAPRVRAMIEGAANQEEEEEITRRYYRSRSMS